MTNNRNIEKFCQYFQGLIIEGRAVKVLSEPSSYNPDIIAEKSKKYDINIKSSDSLNLAKKR